MPTFGQTVAEEFALWRSAFAELSENPVAQFAGLTERDGHIREPFSPQLLRGCAAALAAAILLGLLHFIPGLLQRPGPSMEELHLEVLLGLVMFIAAPIGTLWYFAALFSSARLCLGALARVPGGRQAFSLDASLFFTPLTEREIIAALLAGCASRLVYPLILGSLSLSCAVGLALLGSRLYSYGNPSFDERSMLFALPLFFVSYLLVSTLGTLALLLCCLILGRALSSLLALNAAVFTLCFGQTLWLLWSVQLIYDMAATPQSLSVQYASFAGMPVVDSLLLALLCSVLLALALLGLLKLALADPPLGLFIHFSLPLAGMLLLLLPVALGIMAALDGSVQTQFPLRLSYSLGFALAQFNGLSVAASPLYPLASPQGGHGALLTTPLFEGWRLPLLLGMQLCLLPALLRLALEACRLRRRD